MHPIFSTDHTSTTRVHNASAANLRVESYKKIGPLPTGTMQILQATTLYNNHPTIIEAFRRLFIQAGLIIARDNIAVSCSTHRSWSNCFITLVYIWHKQH